MMHATPVLTERQILDTLTSDAEVLYGRMRHAHVTLGRLYTAPDSDAAIESALVELESAGLTQPVDVTGALCGWHALPL